MTTLGEMMEDVRIQYDLPEYTEAGFVTTDAVKRFINESLKAYYALYMECFGDDYFDDEATLTTQVDVSMSSLPSNFWKLKKLLWVRGTDDIVPLRPATGDYRAVGAYQSYDWNAYPPKYRLQASVLRWYPMPKAEYSLQLAYSAIPAPLTDEEDVFAAGPGHDQWVVNEVCRRIAVREEKDPSVFMIERAEAEKRIRSQASERDEGEPMVLRDVYSHTHESAWARRERLTRL